MAFSINFSQTKNELLKASRGICFDDVLEIISKGEILDDMEHPSKKYLHQRMYVISIKKYIYAIPYVLNQEKKEIFLKTIYPSRVLQKEYRKKG